jgi:hypothetical protein
MARASNRLATFTQAIARTKRAARKRTAATGRIMPTLISTNERASIRHFSYSGWAERNWVSVRAAISCSSTFTSSMAFPGAMRPRTWNCLRPRGKTSGPTGMVSHRSVPYSSVRRGRTPTSV